MTLISHKEPARARAAPGLIAARCALLAVLSLLTGACVHVPPARQTLVSRPAMLFSERADETAPSTLLGQIEPGSVVSGGGQAAGCTACR